tara:strand:- start:13 stop:936 length:924 start_codon:yes stop_codon:yes gene_type:complete
MDDYLKICPLHSGSVPRSSVKMTKFSNLPDRRNTVFMFDTYWNQFRKNNISQAEASFDDYALVDPYFDRYSCYKYLVEDLTTKHPRLFNIKEVDGAHRLTCTLSRETIDFDPATFETLRCNSTLGGLPTLFRWVSMQVECDLVLFKDDGIVEIALASASHWSVDWARDKSFHSIHEEVVNRDGSFVIKDPSKMVRSISSMPEPVERVGALSFRSHQTLNIHPSLGIEDSWTWEPPNQNIFCRFERQTVVPLGMSFLFTIRTFFMNMTNPKNKEIVLTALDNVHPECYPRDFLSKKGDRMRHYISSYV